MKLFDLNMYVCWPDPYFLANSVAQDYIVNYLVRGDKNTKVDLMKEDMQYFDPI